MPEKKYIYIAGIILFLLISSIFIALNFSNFQKFFKNPSEYFSTLEKEKEFVNKTPEFQINNKTQKPEWNDKFQTSVWKNNGKIAAIYEPELKIPMFLSSNERLSVLTDAAFKSHFDISKADKTVVNQLVSKYAEILKISEKSFDQIIIIYASKNHMQKLAQSYGSLISKFEFSSPQTKTIKLKDQLVIPAHLFPESGIVDLISSQTKATPRTIRIIFAGNGELLTIPEKFLAFSLISALPVKPNEVGIAKLPNQELINLINKTTVNNIINK